MPDAERATLAAIPLLAQLSSSDLARLSSLMTTTRSQAGETVFLAAEPGDSLFVITGGRVRIWISDADADDVTLSELGPGDFFGEMAVVDGGTRSANATALEDS